MPNWCYTDYYVTSENEEGMKKVEELFKEATSKEKYPTDFGDIWLGNILIEAGIVDRDGIDSEDCPECRGTLDYFEPYKADGKFGLRFATTTAWLPMFRMFKMVLDKLVGEDNWEVEYRSYDEFKNFITTNIPDEIGTYIYDIAKDGVSCDDCEFLTEEKLREYLKEDFPEVEPDEDISKYIEKIYAYAEEHEDYCYWVSIHQWEYEELYIE